MARHRNLLPDRALAVASLGALALLAQPLAAGGRTGAPAPDTATIVHVLNRMTFGPRPGDVARVEQMALDAYIDQQLHPERIDDTALDARLATFETLGMSSAELADKYFVPAM